MWTKAIRNLGCGGRRNGRTAFALVCDVAALAYLAIGLAHGDLALAIGGCVGMLLYGAVLLLLGRRSEPMALLSGNAVDERQAQLMLRAGATSMQVLAVVLVVAMLVTLATDSKYAPVFTGLCSLVGVSFIVSIVWYSRRG
ncbi:MAG TPA: hypothetical protein VFT67_14250 [Jatrophihabitantaceae bacterium]|jgi:hypothetical protein|nr:hypothetical protein [Jatrophihabitantaceae bacterium]